MHAVYALVIVAALAAVGAVGGQIGPLRPLVGAVLPVVAFVVFLLGVAARVVGWSRSPVPFRIPTTCGQQRSLPWIRASRLENPSSVFGVLARMTLEIGLFRSLFRNTRAELREGPRVVFGEEKLLWLGAVAFHWSLLVIAVRHLRFFLEPVPFSVNLLSSLDGFLQVGVPVLYITDVVIVAALVYLLARRLRNPEVRYISLVSDFLPLFLLLGLVLSGVVLRYVARIDVVAAKRLALSLVTLSPSIPKELTWPFFVHLVLLSALALYFPFSKLIHMGGVFLSPTRNLANTNRRRRHINPWNTPVKVHTYAEWEDEFRDKIRAAGMPLERE